MAADDPPFRLDHQSWEEMRRRNTPHGDEIRLHVEELLRAGTPIELQLSDGSVMWLTAEDLGLTRAVMRAVE